MLHFSTLFETFHIKITTPTVIFVNGDTHELAAQILLANFTSSTITNIEVSKHNMGSFDNSVDESFRKYTFQKVEPDKYIVIDSLSSFDLEFMCDYSITYSTETSVEQLKVHLPKYAQFEPEVKETHFKQLGITGKELKSEHIILQTVVASIPVKKPKEKFDPNDPVIEKQRLFLTNKTTKEFGDLLNSLSDLKNYADKNKLAERLYSILHHEVYRAGLIFPFNWPMWEPGKVNLENKKFDYSKCSLIELSMYITTIVRGERFCDGLIESYIENGTISKILKALKKRLEE